MLQPGVDDALAAVDQIVDVVERIEVADRRHAVLLEQIGMQFDDVAGLRIESDHIDATSERLQIRVRPGGLAKRVHHVKRVFVAIEIQRLESAPRRPPRTSGFRRRGPLRLPAGSLW